MYLMKIYLAVTTLILLQRIVRSQNHVRVDRLVTNHPTWGEWTSWSLCTTSTRDGVRVRSRGCQTGSCDRISGDNYEVQTCTPKAANSTVQKKAYLDRCMNDPAVNGTLSCRLYRENPIMAYGIFKSAEEMNCDFDGKPSVDGQPKRCLFEVMMDRSEYDETDIDELRHGNLFAKEIFSTEEEKEDKSAAQKNETSPMLSQQFENERVKNPAKSQPHSKKMKDIACSDACDAVLIHASRVGEISEHAPKTVSDLINFIQNNPMYRDNSDEIENVYKICLANCRVTGSTKSFLQRTFNSALKNSNLIVGKYDAKYRNNVNGRFRRNTEFKHKSTEFQLSKLTLNKLTAIRMKSTPIEVEEANKKPATDNTTSASRNGTTVFLAKLLAKINRNILMKNNSETISFFDTRNEEHLRSKRNAYPYQANQFHTPCLELSITGNLPVFDLQGNEGELFFYERSEQKFVRKRCEGFELKPGLYQATDIVRQESTNVLAVCKQTYLKRFALIIQLNPAGELSFNNGERFSIRFRAFNLESQCALSTLRT